VGIVFAIELCGEHTLQANCNLKSVVSSAISPDESPF
jgi:hypothetical protein